MPTVELSRDDAVVAMIARLTRTPVSEIQAEHDLRDDLGLDSISALELVALFSEELGIELPLGQAPELRTVGRLVAFARRPHP